VFGGVSAVLMQVEWHSPIFFAAVIIPLAGGYVFVGLNSPDAKMRQRAPLARALVVLGIGTVVVSALLMSAQVLLIWSAATWGGSGPAVHNWPLALGAAGLIAALVGRANPQTPA
jgi:hypothetical protein